jgi:hypothetical protein
MIDLTRRKIADHDGRWSSFYESFSMSWAADYGKVSSLDFDILDRIICGFEEPGTFFFIFQAGNR